MASASDAYFVTAARLTSLQQDARFLQLWQRNVWLEQEHPANDKLQKH
ncbi:hypothetical protein SAMN04488020_105161 [Palleronia marisminoris]|uniref:Uncharacterized protein n=1 Tax=Palleronia marisminoris TaxID=315423 RepID=A0A1Y5SSG1_9RHOB|nr:hypothetical protein SAMN04488020_105161 [Palleronia marisminoris]SLN47469.1 hypothetical protein PAM7066_02105 [Palleronia marisminoris]